MAKVKVAKHKITGKILGPVRRILDESEDFPTRPPGTRRGDFGLMCEIGSKPPFLYEERTKVEIAEQEETSTRDRKEILENGIREFIEKNPFVESSQTEKVNAKASVTAGDARPKK